MSLFQAIIAMAIIGGGAPVPPAGDPRASTAGSAIRAEASGPVSDTLPRPPLIADTDRELFPDPNDRTEARLEGLRGFVSDYQRRTGRLPERLDEAVPPDPRPYVVHADAWGGAFRYTRSPSRDDYDLRSAGPDGRFFTSDDIVVSRTCGTKWAEDNLQPPRAKKQPGS